MLDISDDQFEHLIAESLDELPQEYVKRMQQTVAVTWQDEPTNEQREQLRLRADQTLFGLYEGLPLTQRYSGYGKITPDKITIFRDPILRTSRDQRDLKNHIKHTVWHEMAHYFGLNHDQIHNLER